MQDINEEMCKEIKQIFQNMQTTNDLVKLLNKILKHSMPLELKYLTYYAYSKEKYTLIEIPKKSGKIRQIYSPTVNLKKIQFLLNILFKCLYTTPINTHGFVLKKSNITNAQAHIDKNYIYTIDLKDFFPSIHQSRFWKRLQFPPYNLSDKKVEIASLISNLIFFQTPTKEEKNFLPQGAPTSPIVSNIICEQLDRRLLGLAKRFNVQYTRYADDITFSSNHNVYQKNSEFIIELNRIIINEKFEVNPQKTRLQKRGYRQEVTGIVVNNKANVRREYIKDLRTYLYLIEKYKLPKAQTIFINHYMEKNLHAQKEQHFISLRSVLLGKLEYLKSVKGSDDSTYLKLKNRYDKCFPKEDFLKKMSINQQKKHQPKEVVNILNLFTQNNNPLKYTTHSWDNNKWSSVDEFLKEIKLEWQEKADKKLKELTPKLHAKMANFLFNKNLGEINSTNNKKTVWGMNSIEFGWSSIELEKWTNEKNTPFSYVLDEQYRKKIDGKSIDRFGDIVEVFKNEIEIRSDNNQLKKLFISKQKEYLGFDFNVEFIDFEGVDFYTDVQHFGFGLDKIFKEIQKRKEFPKVSIKVLKKIKEGFIELHITQVGLFLNEMKEDMIKKVMEKDFFQIKQNFTSICDWSIASKLSDGSYKINYLGGDKSFDKLKNEPIGFTHILKFYK